MSIRQLRLVAFGLLAALTSAPGLQAQSQNNRALATRADLEALLSKSGKQALSGHDRERIQSRLQNGDFQNGDRLLILVRGDSALSDTFAVRTGQILVLPDIPPIDLRGVLRSEITPKLSSVISQYVRSPQVEVEPLIRMGLLGQVAHPGYYNVRADVPISEVVMIAGGLGPEAEFSKTKALRGTVELHSKEEIRSAMAAGMSLDQMGFQGGDEILVGRRSGGFSGAVPIITAITGIALAIVGIAVAF